MNIPTSFPWKAEEGFSQSSSATPQMAETSGDQSQPFKIDGVYQFNEQDQKDIQKFLHTSQEYSDIRKGISAHTEDISKKSLIFVTIYKMFRSTMTVMKSEALYNKLKIMLADYDNLFGLINPIYLKVQEKNHQFGKHQLHNNLLNIISKDGNSMKITKLIDMFLALSERPEMIEFNKVAGVNMESPGALGVKESIVPESMRS